MLSFQKGRLPGQDGGQMNIEICLVTVSESRKTSGLVWDLVKVILRVFYAVSEQRNLLSLNRLSTKIPLREKYILKNHKY
jgi:hypothetical protein